EDADVDLSIELGPAGGSGRVVVTHDDGSVLIVQLSQVRSISDNAGIGFASGLSFDTSMLRMTGTYTEYYSDIKAGKLIMPLDQDIDAVRLVAGRLILRTSPNAG
ncbi:MAG: hypothetical protein R3330_01010, partial [Saprospiraceae bacterium]|nr:hypothetical protein [Saprospiraceae bacterium]